MCTQQLFYTSSSNSNAMGVPKALSFLQVWWPTVYQQQYFRFSQNNAGVQFLGHTVPNFQNANNHFPGQVIQHKHSRLHIYATSISFKTFCVTGWRERNKWPLRTWIPTRRKFPTVHKKCPYSLSLYLKNRNYLVFPQQDMFTPQWKHEASPYLNSMHVLMFGHPVPNLQNWNNQ
jgi:hypothetical protein